MLGFVINLHDSDEECPACSEVHSLGSSIGVVARSAINKGCMHHLFSCRGKKVSQGSSFFDETQYLVPFSKNRKMGKMEAVLG